MTYSTFLFLLFYIITLINFPANLKLSRLFQILPPFFIFPPFVKVDSGSDEEVMEDGDEDMEDLEDDDEVYTDEEEVGDQGQMPYINQNFYGQGR